MSDFINTKKEQFLGFDYFFNHTTPARDEFDYRVHKKEYSQYYAKYGFQVSMAYADYYSHMFCPEFSDRFMSADVYYFYVIPCLNRFDFTEAYMDKNYLERVFPGFNKPKLIIKNTNGHFFTPDDKAITEKEAIQIVLDSNMECIAKPSVETGCGVGVQLINKESLSSKTLSDVFASMGGANFNVQEKVQQCDLLSQLNPTSLNTFRIYTYRALSGKIIHLVTSIRFGGKGAFIDNASAGGGVCHVFDDGLVDQTIFKFKTFKRGTLKESLGIDKMVIPNYDRVLDFVFKLHAQVPYFDLVGWDIGIDKNNDPIFIEMNLRAEVDHAQMMGGPMFGEYLDEVMERTARVQKQYRNCVEIKYDTGSKIRMLM